MIKRLFIILLMAATCNAGIVYDRDIYDIVDRKYHRSILENIAFVSVGTAEGQLLYWDATASMWVYSDVTKLKWNDVTDFLLATGFTDGTFIVSGGEISAGEIINTFGDIDIGGNTLTCWDIFTGQIVAHSTSDPQLLLRHTSGVDEAGFYVDSDGDLTITPTGGDSTIIGTTITDVFIVGSNPPATDTSAGVAGTITYDADFLYVAVANNSWKRTALASWAIPAENVIYAGEDVVYAAEQVVYP